MKLREDPLSIALLVAAVVLGVMYFVEEEGARELREREDAAGSIDVSDFAGCEAHAAEFSGDALVIRCPGQTRESIARTFLPRSENFATLVAVGDDGRLRCPTDATTAIPESCTAVEP